MTDILRKILLPQLQFEGAENPEKFLRTFADLYRIELFKDGLDLILTKVQQKQLRFEIKIIKGWDTNVGCFLTEQKSLYDKTLGRFIKKADLKITLRSLTHNVLAHEMAHAWEFEGGINLGEDFRAAIGFDMKDRSPKSLPLKAEIKRLMVEGMNSYPQNQIISELFARYFELLSISRDVRTFGEFSTRDVMDFFENTTNFIAKIFNPQIRVKIDPKIAVETSEIARQIKLSAPEQKFSDRIDSFHSKAKNPQENKSVERSWSKSTKSNSMWQAGWQKHQEIKDNKGEK